MEFLRRWFAFSKGERVAIVTILALILVLILACLFRPSRKSLSDASLHNLDSLLALRVRNALIFFYNVSHPDTTLYQAESNNALNDLQAVYDDEYVNCREICISAENKGCRY